MVADRIAEWLAENGITQAFGIVGGGNVVLWDAITRLGKTKLVCNHHEQAAVMAAAYYQRTSGKIALALVTTGAGSTNALTGVMAAHMDSVPVLVISGNEPSRYMSAPTRVLGVQGYNSSFLVAPMCKWAYRLHADDDVTGMLDRFRNAAISPRQGPVWIDIPKDVQSA